MLPPRARRAATASDHRSPPQREAKERPDEHDQPQDSDVLEGGLNSDGPDDVGRDKELQSQQDAAPDTVRTIR
jgi:hypothetical protein